MQNHVGKIIFCVLKIMYVDKDNLEPSRQILKLNTLTRFSAAYPKQLFLIKLSAYFLLKCIYWIGNVGNFKMAGLVYVCVIPAGH